MSPILRDEAPSADTDSRATLAGPNTRATLGAVLMM
jgi:hypothetical protein